MILVNIEVIHKAFGKGVITKQDGKYITVAFESVEKVFVYPDIFEKFLVPVDASLIEEINQDLASAKDEKQKIIDKKKAENLHAMTHGIVIPGKEVSQNDGEDDDGKFKVGSDSDDV